jgi:type IV pilus assembly protein PilA
MVSRRGQVDGYTFIEVMLVVLIIGLLIAIALPNFIGAKQRASNRAAQVGLRTALTDAKTIYADDDSFSGVSATRLHTAEPSLTFASGPSNGPRVVSVAGTSTQFVAAARASSGFCYAIGDAANPAGTVFAVLDSSATCDATNLPAVPAAVPGAGVATIGGGWAKAW